MRVRDRARARVRVYFPLRIEQTTFAHRLDVLSFVDPDSHESGPFYKSHMRHPRHCIDVLSFVGVVGRWGLTELLLRRSFLCSCALACHESTSILGVLFLTREMCRSLP